MLDVLFIVSLLKLPRLCGIHQIVPGSVNDSVYLSNFDSGFQDTVTMC